MLDRQKKNSIWRWYARSAYSDDGDHYSDLMPITIPSDGDHRRSEATLSCVLSCGFPYRSLTVTALKLLELYGEITSTCQSYLLQ